MLRSLLFIVVGFTTATVGNSATNDASWPQWRGPQRDGVSQETGLLDVWPEEGPPLVWEAKGLGKGYSSVVISDGRIFTLGQQKDGAMLVALSQADGAKLWETPVGAGGPNCTPTVDGDRVYGLGKDGDLVCCNAATGELVWKKSFPADFEGKMMSGWGYSESPLVDGDRLICTPGAPDAQIAALDKQTGATIWKSPTPEDWGGTKGKEGAGYSSIVVSMGGGVKQYVQLTGRGVLSVAADDGRVLWTYNRVANNTANIPTPIVYDDYIFCSSGYGAGAALLSLSKTADGVKAEEVYFLNGNELQNHHGGMVRVGNYVYLGHGHDNGFPTCVEWRTGKSMWDKERGPGTGSAAVLYADGDLYFRYQSGEMALIEAKPDAYKLKSRFLPVSKKGNGWPHPAIVDGKLYLRDQDVLMCYDVRRK